MGFIFDSLLCSMTLFLVLVAPLPMRGQPATLDVHGSVRDTAGHPVVAAYAQLWQDSAVMATAASDSSGRFTLRNVMPAQYTLRISCLGYSPMERAISVSTHLKPIDCVLEELSEEMEAVRVVESRTSVSPEGNVTFRAEGASVAKGRSTLEMLRYVQGLAVERGSVLVNGRGGTKIFLGDSRKTMSIEELRATPATEIERIVVEPYAGVEYGASDDGGIVRVYLVRRIGLSGTFENSLRTDFFNGVWDARSIPTLRYQQGRFYMHHQIFLTPYFKYTTLRRTEQIVGKDITQSDYRHVVQSWGPTYNTALSYEVAEGHTISLYGSIDYGKDRNDMRDSTVGKQPSAWNNDLQNLSGGIAVEYIAQLPVGEKSKFKLWSSYTNGRNWGRTEYHELTNPLDVAQKEKNYYIEVAPSLSFTFGGGHTLRGGVYIDYSVDDYSKQGAELSSLFKQKIHPIQYKEAGGDVRPWLEYSKRFFDRLFFRAGVTGFYYWNGRLDQLNNSRYSMPTEWGIFPNVLLNYEINRDKRIFLQGSYRFLYSLPNYNYFSPDITYVTATQYSIGNTQLRMEYIHMAELSLFFLRGWRATYSFQYYHNKIQVMTHPDPDNPALSFLRPENAGKQQRHNLEVQYNKQLFDFWYTSNRIYGRYGLERSPDASAKYFAVGGSTTQDFTFYPGVGMYVGFGGGMGSSHLNKEIGPWYAFDAGLYASFLNDQLQINFDAGNILYNQSVVTSRFGETSLRRIELTRLREFTLRVVWTFSRGKEVENRNTADLTAPGRAKIQL